MSCPAPSDVNRKRELLFMRRSRTWALLVGALGITAESQPARAQDPAPLIQRVRMTGVQSVDSRALGRGLATQPTQCRNLLYAPICLFSKAPTFADRHYFNAAELRRDEIRIRLYYWRRGYRDVEVTSRVDRVSRGVKVSFAVVENEPTVITELRLRQADSVLPSRVIQRSLTLQSGSPLSMVALDSAQVLLARELLDRGYADATITVDTTAVSNEQNQGPVSVLLVPGRIATIGSIEVAGNAAISPRTISRFMRLQRGDLYRRTDVLESERRLYNSGLFSDVSLGMRTANAADADSAKVLVVQVTEGPLHQLDLASGITTLDFVQVKAEYRRYHFWGDARRLVTRATLSNLLAPQLNGHGVFYNVTPETEDSERARFLQPTYSASVEFFQPWAFGTRNELGASVFSHRRSQPGVVTDRGVGTTMSLTRTISPHLQFTTGYTYELSSIDASDVYFCVSVGLCLKSSIAYVAKANPLAPLSLVGQYDNTNDPLQPTRGLRGRIDLEHASGYTASAFAYNRASLIASTYRQLKPGVVLAGRLRLGAVQGLGQTNQRLGVDDDPTASTVVHPRKLFFAGGSQSVRGYSENQLGPRLLTIDPAQLLDTARTGFCSETSLADRSCDPNIESIMSSAFQPRPLGANAVAEMNIEVRFPIMRSRGLSGAVFVDGAVVGTRRFEDLLGATATIAPGIGIRLQTPAGPVRLDLGMRPSIVERLPVVTQLVGADSTLQLVTLRTPRTFDPTDSGSGWLKQVLSRLTLHLAIGPAF